MNTNVLLIGILVVVVVIAGFVIGRPDMWEGMHMGAWKSDILKTDKSTAPSINADTVPSATSSTHSAKINASNLTDGQKKMLSMMGIDPNTLVITSTMIACANTSLGSGRVKEIEGGATPSFAEGIKLVACYK